MERVNVLYTSMEQIRDLLVSGTLRAEAAYCICMHTGQHTRGEAVALARQLKVCFPQATVVGTSANDIIYNGKLYEHACVISFLLFANTRVQVRHYNYASLDAETLARQVTQGSVDSTTRAMLQFFSGQYQQAFGYTNAFSLRNRHISVSGGQAAGIVHLGEESYVFTDEDAFENALLTVSFHNAGLYTFADCIIGHEPIGEVYTITGTNGWEITEIEHQPAVTWFKELLGQRSFQENVQFEVTVPTDILLRFPLVYEGHNGASRFVQYIPQDDAISLYVEPAPLGQQFRIGYLSPMASADSCYCISQTLQSQPIEAFFCYSCMFRKNLFNRCAEWELTPFRHANVCGALMNGEISTLRGSTEYLNGSCSIMTISEAPDANITIDMEAFSNLRLLEDDGRQLLDYVLKHQNYAMRVRNQVLVQQVIDQQNTVNDRMFTFPQTSRPNLAKFMYDNADGVYDKACLISIVKGEAAESVLGDRYLSLLMADIADIEENLQQMGRDGTFAVYMYNRYAFLVVAKRELPSGRFLKVMEQLFASSGTCAMPDAGCSLIHRFAVVSEESDMMDKIRLLYLSKAEDMNRFFVYHAQLGIERDVEKEMKMVIVINEAIANDGIIPYFQPIHDNQNGGFHKYEALMRLQDKNGKLYYPDQFLPVAKEYKLYSALSTAMINKVFDLFDDRQEHVSINLSAYDINAPEIREMIYARLATLQEPDRFIFEVLESEEFRDTDVLMAFIRTVRSYGVSIAVDDFGSGFSNLLEIANLNPNYIKIDGQIIRDLLCNELNQKIVGTILYLANALQIDLIAEYVENAELQAYISQQGIRYSQGYHFSRPVPYEAVGVGC